MSLLPQKWRIAGIAGLGLSCASLAFGQASGQTAPSPQAMVPVIVYPQSQLNGTEANYPRGGVGFPQGRQSLANPGTSASPQIGGMTTPYGMIQLGAQVTPASQVESLFATGQVPSGQASGMGGGAYGGAGGAGGMPPGSWGVEPGAGAGAAGAGAVGMGAGAAGVGAGAMPSSAPGAAAGAAAAAGGLPEGVLAGLGREAGITGEAAFSPPNVIGDQSPLGFRSFQIGPPGNGGPGPVPGQGAASVPYPTVRVFKISENQSPRPQDRFYFNFNFYNNVNQAANAYDGVPIRNMQAYRYLFGFEKTFDQGMGSFGLRFPINNLTADPISRPGFQNFQTPTRTAVGNLDIYAKYILKQDRQTGSLISAGFLVSTPTGPGRFAGAPYIQGLNDVSFQPFLGYIWNGGDWYFQGFTGFYFPTITQDNTLMYNDVVVGYYILRNEDPGALLSAVVPTFEVHVNTPFTHTNWHDRTDIAAAPTVVNLTWGLNFQFGRTSVLTAGYVLPVTNPQPFTGEFCLMMNIFYGRTRAGLIPITPPPTL